MTTKIDFSILNNVAKKHGIVLFGSTAAANIPINELMQDYDISQPVYNRSISGLKLMNAEDYLESCIYHLKPSKIILNLGEEDLKICDDIEKLIEQYRWLLYKIHTKLPNSNLILTSVATDAPHFEEFNKALKKLSDECGCEYINILPEQNPFEFDIRFFRMIKSVFFDNNMSYSDIIKYCSI